MSAVPDLEYTALRMLTDGEEKLREAGTTLWLVAMNPEVLKVVQRHRSWDAAGTRTDVLHPGTGGDAISGPVGTITQYRSLRLNSQLINRRGIPTSTFAV